MHCCKSLNFLFLRFVVVMNQLTYIVTNADTSIMTRAEPLSFDWFSFINILPSFEANQGHFSFSS